MGSVTRTRNARLGIKLAKPREGEAVIGWALFNRSRPKPELPWQYGNNLALAREAAEEMRREDRALTIFSYLNDDAYRQSIAAREGMPRADHAQMVETIAAQLAAEDFDIIICEVD